MDTREEIQQRMNGFGLAGEPFFFAVSYDRRHAVVVPESDQYSGRKLAFSFPSISYDSIGVGGALPEQPYFIPKPMEREEYAKSFDAVRDHLLRGDSYLLNLCVETPVETNLECSHLFHFAEAPYCMMLAEDESIPGVHGRECVCFSPEPFVRIAEGKIATYPMKGTVDADDEVARRWLESDEKENRESATIVDLMRNDLSRVASNVEVKRYRYMTPVKRRNGAILQCSSEIVGDLPCDWKSRLGDILMELLPAGSITGAPKFATCQAIQEAETMERGYYTGIFGYFDGEELESAVAIRFMEKTPNGMVYKSGGGITIMSQEEEEYREVISKVYVPFDF